MKQPQRQNWDNNDDDDCRVKEDVAREIMAVKAEGLAAVGGMATAACTVALDMVVLLAAGYDGGRGFGGGGSRMMVWGGGLTTAMVGGGGEGGSLLIPSASAAARVPHWGGGRQSGKKRFWMESPTI
jgi:hypothetical protein